eukprot:TRINITY_DN9284_c0_g1_i2.p1 TRINITY_DN9284_c0_g1~~TRINITY_DN9284_c0_g1_i2.p1  ORF type:complete len:253 (-),score=53.40 TRINITY_DN9284_c0_g1_i2:229-987(-)
MKEATAQPSESPVHSSLPTCASISHSHVPPVKSEERTLEGEAKEEGKERKRQKASSEKEENYQAGKWTREEHTRFMDAYANYGKNWKKIQEYVATRTITQVRSHAQKCLSGSSTTRRHSKDAASPETPEASQKIPLPKTRKRTQSNKTVSSVKKAKVNLEDPQSELYPETGVLLRSGEVTAAAGIAYSGFDPVLAPHYHSAVANELENSDVPEFEFDFSEAEIKPLNLDASESKSLWRSTETDERQVQNLLA